MPLYQLATEILESSLPFPELLPSERVPTLHFDIGAENKPLDRPRAWVRTVELEDGRLWLGVGRQGDDYLLHFPDHGDFLFACTSGRIICLPKSASDLDTIRHLFLDHVIPLVFNQRGLTVLHASAVATPSGRALAFLGKSGSGKSTLAASLCQDGCALLADDCLVLDETGGEFLAVPTYPGLRLWESSTEQLDWHRFSFPVVASYTEKKRVAIARTGLRYETEPKPITTLYLVNQDWEEVENVGLTLLNPSEALIALVACSYCLDPGNKQRNEIDFQRLARLVQTVPVMHVQFPYDFSQMAAVREAVLSAPAGP